MIKKIMPEKFRTGFYQLFFTLSQTVKLVWGANPRLLFFAFLVNVISGILVFPTLYVEKMTIDAMINNLGNPLWQEVLRILALLFFIRVTIGIFQFGLNRISNVISYAIARIFNAHVDVLMGQQMANLDMGTIDDPVFKDRYEKVRREGGRRSWGMALPLIQLPNYFFSALSSFSILFLFSPWVAVIIFLLAIPEFFVDAKFTKLGYDYETKIALKNRIWGMINSYLTSTRSFLEVKVLGLNNHFVDKLKNIQKDIFEEGFSIRSKREGAHFLTYLPQNIFAFFFSLYLGLMAIQRAVSVGSAQMYLRAIYSFQGGLTGLVSTFLDLYENYLFVADFVWFLNLKPIIVSGKKTLPKVINNGIEFKNVWFRYKEDQPWILKDINFKLDSFNNLAIVGENGAGKTTLIKLLCRFYDSTKGEILLNGINIKEYDRKDLWHSFSVLFQDFMEYPFSSKDSIGYGNIDEIDNMELIIKSAKMSSIHEFIDSLPLKYENPLAPEFIKGVKPSTGQWQRIGLARVFMRDARIIVLDEPTSNVDPKSEEEIFDKLITSAKKKYLILISHRFSTVRKADKICVMDKGKIVEYGTHEELMKKKGMYEELFNLQAKSYQ